MEERRRDHDKQAAQRREEERLLKKEKERKQEQKRLAEEKAEEEAQVVKNQLLQANLGPTPSRPGALVSFHHAPLSPRPPPSPSPMNIWTLPTPPPATPFPPPVRRSICDSLPAIKVLAAALQAYSLFGHGWRVKRLTTCLGKGSFGHLAQLLLVL